MISDVYNMVDDIVYEIVYYVISCNIPIRAGGYTIPSVHQVPATAWHGHVHAISRFTTQGRFLEAEGDYGPPDPDDDADFKHGGGECHAQADPLDPLADFIKELKDLSSMSGPGGRYGRNVCEGRREGLPLYIAENSILFHIRHHM